MSGLLHAVPNGTFRVVFSFPGLGWHETEEADCCDSIHCNHQGWTKLNAIFLTVCFLQQTIRQKAEGGREGGRMWKISFKNKNMPRFQRRITKFEAGCGYVDDEKKNKEVNGGSHSRYRSRARSRARSRSKSSSKTHAPSRTNRGAKVRNRSPKRIKSRDRSRSRGRNRSRGRSRSMRRRRSGPSGGHIRVRAYYMRGGAKNANYFTVGGEVKGRASRLTD